VTKEVYQAFILEKVVPAIKAKMRHRRNAPIYIQQDNAWPSSTWLSRDPSQGDVATAVMELEQADDLTNEDDPISFLIQAVLRLAMIALSDSESYVYCALLKFPYLSSWHQYLAARQDRPAGTGA
jgi:hypothetical protein